MRAREKLMPIAIALIVVAVVPAMALIGLFWAVIALVGYDCAALAF